MIYRQQSWLAEEAHRWWGWRPGSVWTAPVVVSRCPLSVSLLGFGQQHRVWAVAAQQEGAYDGTVSLARRLCYAGGPSEPRLTWAKQWLLQIGSMERRMVRRSLGQWTSLPGLVGRTGIVWWLWLQSCSMLAPCFAGCSWPGRQVVREQHVGLSFKDDCQPKAAAARASSSPWLLQGAAAGLERAGADYCEEQQICY